jgi:beta-glucosidase
MIKKIVFPEDFLWGTAISGHQVEGGNNHSDWWHWEKKGLIRDGTVSGNTVDYWNRFEEDHDLMVKLGYPAIRLGIEWARIEPEPGKYCKEAIEHYRQILASLRKRKIKICVTLNHWVLPQWVTEQKDWLNPKTILDILNYAELVIKSLGEFVDLWITLNEPVGLAIFGNLLDEFPPQRNSFIAYFRTMRHMLEAHTALYYLIHRLVPKAPNGELTMVGIAQAYPYIVPWNSGRSAGIYEKAMTKLFRLFSYEWWDRAILTGTLPLIYGGGEIKGLQNSYDFCGINYYFRMSLKFDKSKVNQFYINVNKIPKGTEKSQTGWQIYPLGIYNTIQYVWKHFHKPIYITENGIADDNDTLRPKYILNHLACIHRAIEEQIPVKGYFYWSLMDNFEWREGFAKKFGLIAVDHSDLDLKRVPRESAYLYSDIIRNNCITADLVQKFAPDLMPELSAMCY